jgi:tRNA (guanine37-N1)-methyltransferase
MRLAGGLLALLSTRSSSFFFRSTTCRHLPLHRMPLVSLSSSERPVIDRASFSTTLDLVALKIPAKKCTLFLNTFKTYLWDRPRMKRVWNVDGEDEKRYLLLSNKKVKSEDLTDLPSELQNFVKENNATAQKYPFTLTYDDLTLDEVFARVFPDRDDTPSSFEQVGHLAHVNLREQYLEHKHLIGQVILDKSPQIKTVVNKVGTITTTYRTFPMELLAGDDTYDVELRESGARFAFNFAEVYWNSRLQMEHRRLVDYVKEKSLKQNSDFIVADLMCGIGPFAIPLSMSNITVHANDLNPASYKYLVQNGKLNKCQKHLKTYNMDGRAFVLDMCSRGIVFDAALMNLPQTATDFLDVFIGLAQRRSVQSERLPDVHVYAFSNADDPIDDVRRRCASTMRIPETSLPSSICKGHLVRDVAPKKIMVCLSFPLPKDVADADPLSDTELGLARLEREGKESGKILGKRERDKE